MGFHELERQRKTKPGPGMPAAQDTVRLGERLHDFFQLGRGHADPRIGHRQVDGAVRMPVRRDPDQPPGGVNLIAFDSRFSRT